MRPRPHVPSLTSPLVPCPSPQTLKRKGTWATLVSLPKIEKPSSHRAPFRSPFHPTFAPWELTFGRGKPRKSQYLSDPISTSSRCASCDSFSFRGRCPFVPFCPCLRGFSSNFPLTRYHQGHHGADLASIFQGFGRQTSSFGADRVAALMFLAQCISLARLCLFRKRSKKTSLSWFLTSRKAYRFERVYKPFHNLNCSILFHCELSGSF